MSDVRIQRLKELAHAVADRNLSVFTMRVPAEPDRDADLVISWAAREIERLRAELAEWKQEWQTMETAPKDGSRILLATPSGKIADGFWSLEYRVWSWPYVMVEPTHWTRSLPIPGRKGEGE